MRNANLCDMNKFMEKNNPGEDGQKPTRLRKQTKNIKLALINIIKCEKWTKIKINVSLNKLVLRRKMNRSLLTAEKIGSIQISKQKLVWSTKYPVRRQTK